MKTELVQIVFFTIVLVLAAAVQEMAPAFGGAKPPLLLLVALCEALRPSPPPLPGSAKRQTRRVGWLVVAAAAGVFADALDELPTGCMAFFTMFACAAARLVRESACALPAPLAGLVVGAIAAPCQEAWLALWIPSGSALVRFVASAPAAAAAGAALFAMAPRIARITGLDGVPDNASDGGVS